MHPPLPLPTAVAEAAYISKHRPVQSLAKALAGKVTPAQTAKSPLSVWAPVSLARPLSVFGAKLEVHLSASCTLNPSTAMEVVMDTSLLTFLRTENPALLQSLKTLIYAGTGKHRPSETTRKVIKQNLRLTDPEAIAAILDGREPPPAPPHSDWRTVLLGMGEGESNFVRDIATTLASWDDQALHIRELVRAGQQDQAHAHTAALMGTGTLAWEELNHQLLRAPQVLVLVESGLQTLARLMCGVDMPSMDLPSRESQITELLETRRRPLGHWLHEVTLASDCKSFPELAQSLLRADARHHDRAISPDLLKKWSSSKSIAMPQTALIPVLLGVRDEERAKTLKARYYVARFLTFLCDLTWAGIPGETPDWADIQARLKDRYSQVYRHEAANWPAPGSPA